MWAFSTRALCVLFLLGAGIGEFSTAADARVILREKTKFYTVKGRSGREIFKSMLNNGPRLGGANNHALATTEYQYDVKNVDLIIRRGRCIPVDLDVHVDVTYTYPKWTGHRSARRSTRAAWKSFMKSVVWHEKQHVKIALEYAEDYQKALKKSKLRARDKCNSASFASVWRATRAALKHNRKQRAFDRRDLRPGGRGYKAQMELIQAD